MTSDIQRIATVFGGSGFIGHHLLRRLARDGYLIRIASRDTEHAALLKPMGAVGQIVPLHVSLDSPAAIDRALLGAHVAVNLTGILAERKAGDFERVHSTGARLIAERSAAGGVHHLVHLSAIGADAGSPSAYGRSKAAGEAAVAAAFPGAIILRPSIVFGPEDAFFNRFGAMAALSPVMPVISGDTKFQPVYVGDVAAAIAAAIALSAEAPRLYELGGPAIWSFREILRFILQATGRTRPLYNVPPGLARLQASILERLPGKLLTRDQLAMLGRDNVPSGTLPGLDALGIAPKPVELIMPSVLARYRQGGKRLTKKHLAPIN